MLYKRSRDEVRQTNVEAECTEEVSSLSNITAAKKRRLRRNKLKTARTLNNTERLFQAKNNKLHNSSTTSITPPQKLIFKQVPKLSSQDIGSVQDHQYCKELSNPLDTVSMSSKSREDVLAAREAKKLAKLKAKHKSDTVQNVEENDATPTKTKGPKETDAKVNTQKDNVSPKKNVETPSTGLTNTDTICKDEVDRAVIQVESVSEEPGDKTKEQNLTERASKKTAKQTKKKGVPVGDISANQEMTVKDVVETLKDIKNVAKEVQDMTAKVSAIHIEAKKPEEEGKSKAELKAQRRAKQEAQRAAKQAVFEDKPAAKPKEPIKPMTQKPAKPDGDLIKAKSPKPKMDKPKPKSTSANKVNWFQHLYTETDKEALEKIAINSNLHPAIIKLGVQLASRVVRGSNARCIALLDALKKMVKDYTLPAKTEFARGLESHLASSLEFLWAMRQPSASQTNAVKYFRHHLTQLPNNVDEFDAKKTLQEEIDKYIEDQIDKAGEAISMAVRNKISTGDNVLTYGCSSLIERILVEAWVARLQFRTVVVGDRVAGDAREMLRRLVARGLPCTYVDITAISAVMNTINKVLLGASALLVNGSVLGAVGTAQVALVARARNVPVLVACETHKFSERVQTDAFVYNEIGDPDELILASDENSPLKDWRLNPNLTPLNLIYDVTPPSLVTAVVTEKAILPCTSAPVVLRTKLSEYGM